VDQFEEAMKLVRDHGADKIDVFKAVTINPAKTLGLDKRLGSLEKGKDADIAIYKGHPVDPGTVCAMTIINGEVVYRA